MKAPVIRKIAVVVLLTFTMSGFNHSLSTAAQTDLLGQVTSTGKSEVFIDGSKWSPIEGSFPVLSGTKYRTNEGLLSFSFKDGTRIDVGSNSEIAVEGSPGDYILSVFEGKAVFYVPEGSHLHIGTRNAKVEGTNAIGGVLYYRGTTEVTAASGTLGIKTAAGGDLTLENGNSAIVYSDGRTPKVLPMEAFVRAKGVLPRESREGRDWVLAVIGITGAVVGIYFLGASSGTDNVSVASPSSP